METTGKRIGRLLIDLGLNQKELVERVAGRGEGGNQVFKFETTAPLISRIVNDKGGITPPLMCALAEALGTTIDYLMCAPWADEPGRAGEGAQYLYQEDAERAASLVDSIADDAIRQQVMNIISTMADNHAESVIRKDRFSRLFNEINRLAAGLNERERRGIENRLGIKLSPAVSP